MFKKIFTLAALSVLPCVTFAKGKSRGDILHLQYSIDQKAVEDTSAFQEKWAEICKLFQNSSMANTGLGDSAIFDSVKCSPKPKLRIEYGPRDLIVYFDLKSNSAKLDFFYGLAEKNSFLHIETAAGYDLLDVLTLDTSYWDLLLKALYARLPIHAKPAKKTVLKMQASPRYLLPQPISDCSRIAIFTLDLISELPGRTGLRPTAWAYAQRPGNLPDGRKIKPNFEVVEEKMQSQRHYLRCIDQIEVSEDDLARLESDFWRVRKKTDILISKKINAQTTGFSDQFLGGYVALKYGIATGSSIEVSKSRYMGFDYEQRKGLLKGLRFHYDRWSQTSHYLESLNASSSLGGQRLNLGWSFGPSFDWFISRIDFTPSIGIWDYRAKYPFIDFDDVLTVLDFTVDKAVSVDLSFGLESSSKYHSLRLWGGRAVNLSGNNKPSISSTKLGVDLLLPTFNVTGNVDAGVMLFYNSERVTISRAVSELLDSSDNIISSVSFVYGFVGLGVAIRW